MSWSQRFLVEVHALGVEYQSVVQAAAIDLDVSERPKRPTASGENLVNM
jgi:hypothetical protein